MGGLGEKLRSWDRTTDRIDAQGPAMDGPFALRADGTPLQLGMTKDAKTGLFCLQLWDAAKQTAKVFELPDGRATLRPTPSRPRGPTSARWWNQPRASENSLSGRQRRAGSCPGSIIKPSIWLSRPMRGWSSPGMRPGQLRLWRCPRLPRWPRSGRGPRPSGASPSAGLPAVPPRRPRRRWLLAVGDAGGTVTVWDLEKQVPMNYCRGSHYDVYAVAFSPDGTTLASAGRGQAKLWDVATGRLLLNLSPRNVMTALAFSPDGMRLAVGSQAAFSEPGGVDVYELEEGVAFEPSVDCGAGPEDDLLPRRTAHRRAFTGLASCDLGSSFRPASSHSGCAPGPSRRQLRPGLQPRRSALRLLGRPSGEAMGHRNGQGAGGLAAPRGLAGHARLPRAGSAPACSAWKRQDGEAPPNSSTSPVDHPRVMRLRNLLGDRPTEPLRTITDFNRFVHHSAATPDGKYFVVEGVGGLKGDTRSVNAYDGLTGAKLWTFPSRKRLDTSVMVPVRPDGEDPEPPRR